MIMRVVASLLTLSLASTAAAQENGLSFRFGLGPKSAPGYFGADENEISPTGSFELERLQWGPLAIGGPKDNGFGFGGSVRFVGERSASDFDELDGLDDVDASLEFGGGIRFRQPAYSVFADVRYGVIGHESLVAEMGGDYIYRPNDQLTLRTGPRILWGSDDYAQTYFGVTQAESVTSSYAAFDAGAGIVSAGVKAEATYQFNDDWGVIGTLRYDQLREDAADSPITQSEDQVSASIVLTRKITFGF